MDNHSEGEIITSKKMGDLKPTIIKIVSEAEIGKGGASKPNLIEGKIGDKNVEVVVKKIFYITVNSFVPGEKESMTIAERYYARWKYLWKNGISTVGSMRVIGNDEVLMGNVTAHGGEFFGSGYFKTVRNERWKRDLTTKEKRFLEIYNNGELVEKVKAVSKKMEGIGLVFPHDDPFDVLIHDDGTFDVLVMDLAELHLINEPGVEKMTLEDALSWESDLHGVLEAIQKDEGENRPVNRSWVPSDGGKSIFS